MPSYHSIFNQVTYSTFCDIPQMEIKNKQPTLDFTKTQVPADQAEIDIIDEAIIYFRANVLFKNYTIDGPADKLLVYITVFIQKCLEKAAITDASKAKKEINALVDSCEYTNKVENFFNVLTKNNPSELPYLQKYLKSVRKETVKRMLYILYEDPKTAMDLPYWVGLGKKKFMGYDMMTSK